MVLDGSANVAGLGFEEMNFLCDETSTLLSVGMENNQNLTAAEKERLLYHFKLGHAHFQWIQSLLAQPRDPQLDSILPYWNKGPSNATRQMMCAACEIGKQARRTPETHHAYDEGEMYIRQDDLIPWREGFNRQLYFCCPRKAATHKRERKK